MARLPIRPKLPAIPRRRAPRGVIRPRVGDRGEGAEFARPTRFWIRPFNFGFAILLIAAALVYFAPLVNSDAIGIEPSAQIGARATASFPVLLAAAAAPAPPAKSAAAPAPLPAPVAKKDLPKPDKNGKLIDDFFATPIIPTLTFEFNSEEWEFLKRDHRRYVEGTMTERDGKVSKGVAVKLKGAAGSFQGPEGKPGLTVSFNKYKGAERYRGMTKFHLNNGAQDGTYLMELIAGEMCRKAGVPASRCSHAIVKWQGRDLGLYVLKEAFTKDFLAHFFQDPNGDLYDGGFVRELDGNEEKDQGDEKQRDNIKALVAACREGDATKRAARLEAILDIDKYISFTAMEAILAHWDGYNFNRNNYRVYFDATSKKAVFFAHGMDQPFGDPNFPAVRDSGSMVGQAVFSNPVWRAKYSERVEEIYEKVLKPIDWPARVTEAGAHVKAALEKANPKWAQDYGGQIVNARSRVEQRIAAIGKQLGDMPKPLRFSPQGIAKIEPKGWEPQGSAAQIDEAQQEGRPIFRIKASGETNASWRKSLALDPGKYRFEARVRTIGVEPLAASSGEGAGVRISGATRTAPNAAKGDAPWQTLGFQFDAPGGPVVLVAELRARKGEVWFDKDSFQIVRVQ